MPKKQNKKNSWLKDILGAAKSKRGLKKMRGKMYKQINKEKSVPASLGKQAARNARRQKIGYGKGPKLKWQGVHDKKDRDKYPGVMKAIKGARKMPKAKLKPKK